VDLIKILKAKERKTKAASFWANFSHTGIPKTVVSKDIPAGHVNII
jgi:hypothetical protein